MLPSVAVSGREGRLMLAVAVVGSLLGAAPARAATSLVCAGGAGADPCVINTKQDFINAGVQTFDLRGRALVIGNGGRIKVTPGGMTLVAGSVQVKNGGALVATGASGTAGSIAIVATGDLRVNGTGIVNVSAATAGGQVNVLVGGSVQIDGTVTAQGTGVAGTGGAVATVAGGTTTISATGVVLADGGAAGGSVAILSAQDISIEDGTAPRIDVGGPEAGSIQLVTTATGAVLVNGIVKAAATQNSGDGGSLSIDSAGYVALSPTAFVKVQGGQIGGTVGVTAVGPIELASGGGSSATIDVSGRAQAGTIGFSTGPGSSVTLGGTVKAAGSTVDGTGGTVTVQSLLDVTISGATPVIVTGGTATGTGGELNVAAGGAIAVTGPVAASGADGGRIILQAGAWLATTAAASLDASAAGSGGYGGLVSLSAQSDATVGGPIRGGGSGQGATLELTAGGNVLLGATIDVSGGAPDGNGGAFDLHADGPLTQNAAIVAHGRGAGCGLSSQVFVRGALALGDIDVGGDTCGGSLTVTALGPATAAGEIAADATIGVGGGVDITAVSLDVWGNLHASGTDAGGQVALHACDLTLEAGSRVTATGPTGRNLLQANATMTIGGAVLGTSNALQYAGQPPVVLPTGSVLPGTIPVRVAAVPCGAATTTSTSSTSTSSTTTSTSSTSTSSTTTTPTTSTSSTAPDPTTPGDITTSTSDTTATTEQSTTTIDSSSSTSSSSSSSCTSTTGASSSSTTSSTEPPIVGCDAGTPGACDDGDPCTEDVCAGGQCVNLPPEGIRMVTCPLDVVESTLRAASPDDTGGARIQGRLIAKIRIVQRAVTGAGGAGTPRARGALKRSVRQLNAFIAAVEHGTERGMIRPGLGYRVLAPARQAAANLIPLTSRP